MNSKFSSYSSAFRRPWICKPAPPISQQRLMSRRPLTLNCFSQNQDDDPLQPSHQAAAFPLTYNPIGDYWFGQSSPSGERLAVTLWPTATPNVYTAVLQVWDAWRQPETFTFSHVSTSTPPPFDTGVKRDTYIPARDFREVWILE